MPKPLKPPRNGGFLGLPLVTSVDDIDLDGSAIVCRRSFTNGIETSKTELPAVITVTPAINTPRFMTPAHVIEGLKKGITVWNCTDLGCDESKCGVKRLAFAYKARHCAAGQRG